ncbi:MAG: hypothetical protein ACM3ZV_07465 [Bacillota bacterium]
MDALKITVLFAALDKLSAPLKGISRASKGAQGDLAKTRKEIMALQKAQGQVSRFKVAEAEYKVLGADLKAARLEAKALRDEVAAMEKPTAAMTKKVAAAEAAEQKLGKAYQLQGEKLQAMGNDLERAGVNVAELGAHEESLAMKTYEANKRLDQQTAKLERVQRVARQSASIKAFGSKVSGAGQRMSLMMTLPLVAFAKTSVDAANESTDASMQVEAAITSMGNKAGRSLGELKDQATALMNTSLFDDDDIMRNVTANMLTFGRVSGKIFDRAQQDVVDMAAGLKMELQPATIMVGKALNDPATGLLALSKIGAVSKDWAKANKKTIEGFVKTGQVAKAQGMILQQVENQFRGRAAAARAANPNAVAKQQFGEAQENVGAQVNKALPKILGPLARLLTLFNAMPDSTQQTIVTVIALAAAFGPLLMIIGPLITAFGGLMAITSLAAAPLLAWIALAAILIAVGIKIYRNWDTIKAAAVHLWEAVKAAFNSAVVAIGAALGRAQARISGAWNWIKSAFNAGVSFFASIPGRMLSIGSAIIQGLISGITGRLGALKSTIVNAASSAANWFRQKLGIHSPSRVFHAFGGFITQGLTEGIDAGAGAATRRMAALARQLTAAATLSASIVTSPAMAATAAVSKTPIVPTPVITGIGSAPGRAASAVAAPSVTIHATINITAGPGQDVKDIRSAVREGLEEARRQAEAAARSSYHDDV